MNIRRWITGVAPRLNGCVTNRTFPQLRGARCSRISLWHSPPRFFFFSLACRWFSLCICIPGSISLRATRREQRACSTHFLFFFSLFAFCSVSLSCPPIFTLIYLNQPHFQLLKLIKCHSAVDTENIPPPALTRVLGDQILIT